MKKFHGTGVALVTPFRNKEIDYLALGKVIDYVIEGGVDYLVMLGSTGETATLNTDESRAVLDYTINRVSGRKPIVAGNFGHNNTMELVKQIEKYNFDGIDAILSSSPAYVKPSHCLLYTSPSPRDS